MGIDNKSSVNFHLNLSTGKIGKCKATNGKCPFIDESDEFDGHYETIEEIEDYIERKNSLSEGLDGSFLFNSEKDKELRSIYGEDYKNFVIIRKPINLSPPVEKLIDVLSDDGLPLLVGGTIRDSMSGIESRDIDIEVHKTDIDSIINVLHSRGYQCDEVGKQFGVLKISRNGLRDIDVSVPRKENSVGAGHRDFTIETDKNMSFQEAVQRRDFTFNSIMYDPKRKVYLDIEGGIQDLENKTMRHVSDKFSEDPLRVLRGFQFAGRFGLSYAPETASLAKSIRNEYSNLSVERVRKEFTKFYTKSTNYSSGLKALKDSGWDNIEPGLSEALKDPKVHERLESIYSVKKELKPVIASSIISRNMSLRDRDNFLSKTLESKNLARKSSLFIDTDNEIHNLKDFSGKKNNKTYQAHKVSEKLSRVGSNWEEYEEYVKISNNSHLLEALEEAKRLGLMKTPSEPVIAGRHIKDMYPDKKEGPWLGSLLRNIREMQYSGEIKTHQDAVKIIHEYMKKEGM